LSVLFANDEADRRAGANGFIDPCLPTRAERAPVADGWAHKIKHDGIGPQIHTRGKRIGPYTMTGVDWTASYHRHEETHIIAPSHSITSSARASTDGGTARPRALAVLRLMTNFVLGRPLHR
jgi:ATP-dependent DNA ligase